MSGRGECVPYARYGETLDGVMRAIERAPDISDRRALLDAMPPGAARNALDCALWDLEAKRSGKRASGVRVTGDAVIVYEAVLPL